MFVTFATAKRWILPECVRQCVIDSCLRHQGKKVHIFVALVMPDHVHMIFKALVDREANQVISLPELMSGIKGASAHAINKTLGRKGAVWQKEFFDHVIRSSESLDSKIRYVRMNPVRAGIVSTPEAYPWLWCDRDWTLPVLLSAEDG